MPKFAKAATALSVEELFKLLDYNPLTGALVWRVNRNSFAASVRMGAPAGTLDKYGYRMVVVNGLVYPTHRIAWYLHYGVWPSKQIDHANMDFTDNRIANLREATMTQQRANQRVRRDSVSGLKGVQRAQGRFRARIRKDGIVSWLGYFGTAEEAHEAYAKAAAKLYGEFARSV